MKKVLITGATGFIGRNALEPLIARGFEVHSMALDKLGDDRVHEYQVDIFSRNAVQKCVKSIAPQYLLHMAWFTKHGEFWESEENNRWLDASEKLFEDFCEHGGERATFAGTCAEYQWEDPLLKEDSTPLNPGTLYGKCKNELRERIEKMAANHDVSWAWGRIFFTFGPNEVRTKLIPYVITTLLQDKEAETTSGTGWRDFMSSREIARALVELLDSEVTGAVNIGSGQPRQIKDIVTMIAEIIGKPRLLRLGARHPRSPEPEAVVPDVSRLNEEVGFIAKDNVGEIEETIQWWRDHL